MDIDDIRAMIQKGELEDGAAALSRLAGIHPEDARIQYEAACLHDRMGRESEAVGFYVRAIDLGLPDKLLREALLGLGSTYRCLGRTEEAVRVFEMARLKFPEAREFIVFGAMAYFNLGQGKRAVEDLLRVIAETCNDPDVSQYRRAIELYSGDLDRRWD